MKVIVGEASVILGVHDTTIRSWIKRGVIEKHRNAAGHITVSISDVMDTDAYKALAPQTEIDPKDVAFIDEAIKITGWNRATLLRKGSGGEIISFKSGKKRFFSRKHLLEIAESKKPDKEEPDKIQQNPEKRICSCCRRRPVAPGLMMLCQYCFTSDLAGEYDFGDY